MTMVHQNFEAWSLKNCVNFYVHERTCVADLYESESAMLLPVISHIRSVLDVGCAVGNFSRVFKELNPQISYTGIDSSERMIQEARTRHPGVVFHRGNGRDLPFDDQSFDMVLCTSVLHHNPDYLDMITEIFRVAKRFGVTDLPRLLTQGYVFDAANSYMVLKNRFPAESEAITEDATKVPYVLANVKEAFRGVIEGLSGRLSGLACRGYYGTPHKSVIIPYSPVIFAVVLFVKGRGPIRYCLSLPDDALAMAEEVLGAAGGIKLESVKAVAMSDKA